MLLLLAPSLAAQGAFPVLSPSPEVPEQEPAAQPSEAPAPPMRIALEAQWEARASAYRGGTQARVSELEVRLRMTGRRGLAAFLAADLEAPLSPRPRGAVDEAYLDLGPGASLWRLGRFRLPFGIYDRSEVDYSGFAEPALVKSQGVIGAHLTRSGTGAQWIWAGAPWRLQVSLANDDPPGGFSLRASGGAGTLRIERLLGPWLLGLDGYLGRARGPEFGGRASALGLDWRWATPWLQFRGEALLGGGAAGGERGIHADLWYHVPAIPDLTALARLETARVGGASRSRATLGARYRLRRGPDVTLAVNLLQELSRAEGTPFRAEMQLLVSHRL
jgi:hypothetical protein